MAKADGPPAAVGVPLAFTRRGATIENVHRVAFAAVEGNKVIADSGDLSAPLFYRSTAKPLQALALILSEADVRFGFDDACLALACASHDGTPAHAKLAREMLRHAGLSESQLRCPGHLSLNGKLRKEQLANGFEPGPLHDNCSGKHAGMLAAARAMGEPVESYYEIDHPLQRLIREQIAMLADIEPRLIETGGDGCGVPSFAVPLENLVKSWSRLATPASAGGALAAGCRKIVGAMQSHPIIVAGEGRFDTKVMTASEGHLLAKVGAEGLQLVAAPGTGRALAVKCLDGSRKLAERVTLALLQKLGWSKGDPEHTSHVGVVRDRLGNRVGEWVVDLSSL